jgi:glucose/arabinose dehydrogenase/plastocyanin
VVSILLFESQLLLMKIEKLILVVIGIGAMGVLQVRAANHMVEISNYAFVPANQTIKVGDSVTWTQKDSDGHTSTSGRDGIPDGKWDSPILQPNQTFTQTFAAAGVFPYFCTPHPYMTGTITVEAAQASAPAVAITRPAANTSFSAPTNVTIEATATISDGTITSVEFFDGSTSLGMDMTAPFSVTASLGAGSHSLTAKATASNGGSATSPAVVVAVGTVVSGGQKIDNPIPQRIAKSDLAIELQRVADGLISPLGMAVPDDGSGRLLVYDQAGLVHVMANGTRLEAPLLDVRNRLVALGNYDERGLLGVATHPNFAQKPFIYTYTSEPNGPMADFMIMLPAGKSNNHQSVIAEWRIDPANTNRVDPSSRREILRIDKPQSNHNGGVLRFGPDGFLYISVGDGGAADDQGDGHSPQGNGQDTSNILGKIVRIDVDARTSPNGQYGAPAENPFVNQTGVDEIYAYGFRNPYAFSFDRKTGELYVADVGQNHVEELDLVFKGGNYGWPIKEGGFYFDPNGTNTGFAATMPVREVPADLIDPIAQYDHDEGLSIIGGYVYRGTQIPALTGRYVTADWGSFTTPNGRLFVREGSGFVEFTIGSENRPLNLWVKGFGEDHQGELYVFASTNLGPSGTSGVMLKMVPVENKLAITGLSSADTNVLVSWTNGSGPFVVESSSSVGDVAWKTSAATAQRSATIPRGSNASFVRLADMAGQAGLGFTVHLTGGSERPSTNSSSATGTGIMRLEGNTLQFDIQYSGLTGTATAAHIHGPAPASEAASVLIDLSPFKGGGFGTNGTLSGSVTLTAERKAMLLEGKTYVNVHTSLNPGGEIRGQVMPVVFGVDLTGSSERPNPINTSGRGAGTLLLVGNQLSFNVAYKNLSSAGIAAHIHGPTNAAGSAGVLIDLQGSNGGAFGTNGSLVGTVTLTPAQLAYLADGLTYMNIHTTPNPGGEIRGQILPQVTAIPFTTSLTGAAERPQTVDTPARGSGIFALQGRTLHFNISYSGLKAAGTAAHIHGPADAASPASVLIDLAPFNNGAFGTSGVLAGAVALTEAQLGMLLGGSTYVNVHTTSHPSGEIRGQIASVLWQSTLLGATERPASVQTSAAGTGQFLLVGTRLHMNATYSGLSSLAGAAHIHGPAGLSLAAPVLVDLQTLNAGGFGTAGAFAGSVELTPDQLGHLVDGRTYLNIHTSQRPAGEIRGQIIR